MKHIFFYSILLCHSLSLWAQNNTGSYHADSQLAANDRWRLDKYIWSHMHPQPVKGDKLLIDFDAIDNWMGIVDNNDLSISPDGLYFAYSIQLTRYRKRDSLVVQSTSNAWRQALAGASPGFFSADSRQYIFEDKQGLCFLQLRSGERRYVKDITGYQLPLKRYDEKQNGVFEWLACQLKNSTVLLQNLLTGQEKRFDSVSGYRFHRQGQWLACQLNNENSELLLRHLTTGQEHRFPWVSGYSFDLDGKVLVLKTSQNTKERVVTGLQYIKLLSGKSGLGRAVPTTIWLSADSTVSLSNYSIDVSGRQVLFVVSSPATTGRQDVKINSIWYWKEGMDKALQKINHQTAGIDAGMQIQGAVSFTGNGRYIQFMLQPPYPEFIQPEPDAVQVDVWSYRDIHLQSAQPELLKRPVTYRVIFNLQRDLIVLQETDNEKMHSWQEDVAIMRYNGKSISGDRFWEAGYNLDSFWVVSLQDGHRSITLTNCDVWLNNHYLVYFDKDQANFFSYHPGTGKLVNISKGVPSGQLAWKDYYLRSKEKQIGFGRVAGWLDGGTGLLVLDEYDIWQLDLTGKKQPVNITNGYGRLQQTLFQVSGINSGGLPVYGSHDTLLLKAFNRQNKFNGYYRKILGKPGDPEPLYMGACFMEGGIQGTYTGKHGFTPLKAALANKWIIQRETATDAPNYFMATDFKRYSRLTNLQPQEKYNWLTAELHSFKQLDGSLSQGVLYKPENFNAAKKYPLIISFYGPLSDQLYKYPAANYINCPTIFDDPAWMVSHGYLVFIPDIYFIKNQWGPSTVNTVDGAARYLRQLPYVDGDHMGAAGHSNSGRFGYYLLTHSNSFAAISVGAGTSSIISASLSLSYDGQNSRLDWGELGSYGTGLGNLWKNKKFWLDQTSILNADKVTSPLLMFHNKKDNAYAAGQAVDMYTALRRLEKKVWWLQYDNGGHTVRGDDARDWTIRYTQFFDHYLKGAPAPRWMTQGIRAAMKGIETGYGLDPAGNCGLKENKCKVCSKWNEQYRKTPEMFSKPFGEWHLDEDTVQKQKQVPKATKSSE